MKSEGGAGPHFTLFSVNYKTTLFGVVFWWYSLNMSDRKRNYKIYIISNVVTAFAGGIFGPFFILFVQEKGGSIENFAIAMGLLVLVQSIVAYYAGKYSDVIGRKPLLIFEGYAHAVVVFFYLFITSVAQLYVLQIFTGLLAGLGATVGAAFLGDITKRKDRGRDMGKFNAIVGIMTALTMIAGGYVVATLGLKFVFILMIFADIISTSILLFIKEGKG